MDWRLLRRRLPGLSREIRHRLGMRHLGQVVADHLPELTVGP
ncbi:hypothetical protein [Nonomuraea sp. NPDC048916]